MATYFTHFPIPATYNMPLLVNNHYPILSSFHFPSPYTVPVHVPVTLVSPQIISPVCSYTNFVATEPVIAIPDTVTDVNIDEYNSPYNTIFIEDKVDTYDQEDVPPEQAVAPEEEESKVNSTKIDPVEFYLTLPRELFPSARMLDIDPNPVIDEFCKIGSVNENVSWILDIEFGIPRVPVTRAIAVYDVKYNSIHCKNTPNAIHPGFEKCNSEFRKVILFYYDILVSMWYKGYIVLSSDRCVENFQSWLLIPMQIFGMCWP